VLCFKCFVFFGFDEIPDALENFFKFVNCRTSLTGRILIKGKTVFLLHFQKTNFKLLDNRNLAESDQYNDSKVINQCIAINGYSRSLLQSGRPFTIINFIDYYLDSKSKEDH
jgi:hypothetical protein